MSTHRAPWWCSVALAGLGVVALALDLAAAAAALLAISGAILLADALAAAARPPLRAVASVLAVAGLAALAASPVTPEVRLALAALAVQCALAWLGRDRVGDDLRWPRRILPATGHAAALAGAAVLVTPGGSGVDVALLAYVGGFSVLALHARWSRRLVDDQDDGWEVPLLVALALGILASTFAYVASTRLFAWMPPTRGPAQAVALLALLVALFALASPPALPARLRVRSSGAAAALAHGGATLGLLNLLFVVLSLVATWSARLLIAVVTAYVALAVVVEYRAIRRARLARRRFDEPAPEWTDEEPVTVLIAAREEAATLERSLALNLALPRQFRFLLVPSVSSLDETVAVARAAELDHPERVRVLLGVTGSKAGDLNLAWREIETERVLMLDADETIDEASARWALAALAAERDVAVVQGRKVSEAPEASALSRFIVTERRHATGLDQVMHAELGSSHFAGSAALVRREAIEELGGWTEETMTEDIEFTLRLHLESSWRILYEPRMVVREADPESVLALVQQRTRWARGWTQCFALYFGRVLAARARLGRARAFGLVWLLLMAVSAPAMALLPAFVLMRAVGIPSLLPWAVGVAVASFILPARLVGYGYSALRDPHIPVRGARLPETLAFAYVWILVGWLLSFHALYLELASAPRVWYVTRKRTAGGSPGARAGPARGVSG